MASDWLSVVLLTNQDHFFYISCYLTLILTWRFSQQGRPVGLWGSNPALFIYPSRTVPGFVKISVESH